MDHIVLGWITLKSTVLAVKIKCRQFVVAADTKCLCKFKLKWRQTVWLSHCLLL